ncbi:MAG: hypothetical protein QX203_08595 [Methylococcaceae bacterium]
MKMTFNRRLILLALSEPIDGSPPPHSASSIGYALGMALAYKWPGLYAGMKSVPNKQQIHRTLKELWHDGLIVGNRVKVEHYNQLPGHEVRYQLSGDVYHNWLIAECSAVFTKVKKAKHGINMFGGVFDMGLPESDVKPLMLKVKALIQKTHPDKADGYADEFMQMKQCSDWIKSGIPLPTPTHTAGECAADTRLTKA